MKKRLSQLKRDSILTYMLQHYDETHPASERDRLFFQVVTAANEILRERYPEADMVVLRKYDLCRTDFCLRFIQVSNNRFFCVTLPTGSDLVDVPYLAGCRINEVFRADDAFAALVEEWAREVNDEKEARRRVMGEYKAFLASCRCVEDVEAVVALPVHLSSVQQSSALVAINPDTLARIKADFRERRIEPAEAAA